MRYSAPFVVSLLVAVLAVLGAGCATGPGGADPGESGRGPGGRPGGGRQMAPRDQQQPQESWKQYDLNGDGKITRGEFMAVRALCFARYDANGYGTLTRVEVRKFSPRQSADRIEAAFSRLDVDGDGQISREEFDQGSDRLFRHVDTNGDGIIAGMELGNLNSVLLGDICQSPGAPESGEGRPRPGRGGAGPGERR